MALVNAPLLAMRARGQIGKSIVFSHWKGRATARSYVIPANPNTAAQQLTRNAFMWVHDAYKSLTADAVAGWNAKAKSMKIAPANAWASANVGPMRVSTDAHELNFMPQVNSGPPAPAPALTPGSGTIAATLTAPSIPSGWTIDKALFFCLKEQTPRGELYVIPIDQLEDATAPYSVTFTGLLHTQAYVVGGSFIYSASLTKKAYSASVNAVATTT